MQTEFVGDIWAIKSMSAWSEQSLARDHPNGSVILSGVVVREASDNAVESLP
jgi:hypothetical protein